MSHTSVLSGLTNKQGKKTGQEMSENQPMSKDELCEDFSERLGHCAQDHLWNQNLKKYGDTQEF